METRAGRAQIQAINRTKVHRLHPAREIGEAGKDEDDEAEEEELDKMLEFSKHRVQDKDKQAISRMPVIIVEDLAIGPVRVQVNMECTEEEEDEVAVVEDVSVAEARDVKQVTRAWLETVKLRVLEPRQHLHNRRETSEAPEWPVQWTDGAYTPEPSKPIWRGSKESEDLIIADAEEEAT